MIMPQQVKPSKADKEAKRKKFDSEKIKHDREKEMVRTLKEKREQRFEAAKLNF